MASRKTQKKSLKRLQKYVCCLPISFVFKTKSMSNNGSVFDYDWPGLYLEARVSEPVWKAASWCLWHKLMMSSDMMECHRSPGDHTLSLPSYPPCLMMHGAWPPHIAHREAIYTLHYTRTDNTRVRTGTQHWLGLHPLDKANKSDASIQTNVSDISLVRPLELVN